MATTIFTIEVSFNDEVTDAESVAGAADMLLETALSTPEVLDDYGNPSFGAFMIQHHRVPLLERFISGSEEEDELDKREFLGMVADRINDDLGPSPFSVDDTCRKIVHYYLMGEGAESMSQDALTYLLDETWKIQDGYGEPGFMPPQGWDWSGIRDSSDGAMRKMAATILNFIAD